MGDRFYKLEIWIEEFREDYRKQKNRLLKLIEEIRKEYKNQRSKWEKEREKIKEGYEGAE